MLEIYLKVVDILLLMGDIWAKVNDILPNVRWLPVLLQIKKGRPKAAFPLFIS